MKLIAAAVLILFVLFEGLGDWIADQVNCTVGKYGAPYGAAAFFALIAILYYPVESSIIRLRSCMEISGFCSGKPFW